MLIILFGASLLFVWPVLLPINAVNQRGSAGGVQGLDLLSISNINSPNRYWAHVSVGIAFISSTPFFIEFNAVGFTCFLLYHELDAFIRIRQDNLTSDLHKGTVRATTILVTSIPKQFLDVKTLRQVFSVFPGGVKNVFLNRDCSDLMDMVQLRDSIAHQLEGAETELICTANQLHRKEMEKKAKQTKKKQKKATEGAQVEEPEERIELAENESLVDRYVPTKKRPTYRIPLAKWMPSLPLIGKKVSLFESVFLIE
jgi:calcium permeable stress-gated cation channel